MQIEYVSIASVTPYKGNVRAHAEKDVAAIKASIEAFGFCDPIGVWHNTIVEGHGRYQAALELGLKEIPIIHLDELTDEQRRAYAIAHNKTTELSEWSYKNVTEEINSLDVNMALFGFWEKEEPPEREARESDLANVMGKDEKEKSDAGCVCPRCGAWVK